MLGTTTLTKMLASTGEGVVLPFFNKLLGPGAEELGLVIAERARIYRLKNTFYLFKKAQELAQEAGFEPKQVNLKTLLPLIEGASLEDDVDLATKWASLLANAADPTESKTIKPIYSDILRQLTPQDAKVLDILLLHTNEMLQTRSDLFPVNSPKEKKRRAIESLLSLYSLRNTGGKLSEIADFESIVDNLLRQRLLIEAPQQQGKGAVFTAISNMRPMHNRLFFSSMGYDFMLACTPPTPSIK